ncbi:hypothetical protein BDN72DRAFT_861199 [Pluteus cervinus]|uniref:Uncharacterized protein n=1 Tax=Pluteus cervinus TaxID=181527 RepID=A0ACD3AG21_9AGAR|nr:hypothetical protein BDN72DRAFT_861199 [Pluteus cervinus]
MAYFASASPDFPYLPSCNPWSSYLDADSSSVWASGDEAMASPLDDHNLHWHRTESFESPQLSFTSPAAPQHHEELAEILPTSLFQKSVHEEEVNFYAVFPEARPAGQLRAVSYPRNETSDDSWFYVIPSHSSLIPMAATMHSPAQALPTYRDELSSATIDSWPLMQVDLSHHSAGEFPHCMEVSFSSPDAQVRENSVEGSIEREADDQPDSYGNSFDSYFTSSPTAAAGIEDRSPSPQDPVVSNEHDAVNLPDLTSPEPEEADTPSSFSTTSSTLDLLEEQLAYHSSPAVDEALLAPAVTQYEQLAPASRYTLGSALEQSIPFRSSSSDQHHGGIHQHEQHGDAHLVASPPRHDVVTEQIVHPSQSVPPHPSPTRAPLPQQDRSRGAQWREDNRKRVVPHIACNFCRGRKVACEFPDPESEDSRCRRCQIRNQPCETVRETRRGFRKAKKLKTTPKKTPPPYAKVHSARSFGTSPTSFGFTLEPVTIIKHVNVLLAVITTAHIHCLYMDEVIQQRGVISSIADIDASDLAGNHKAISMSVNGPWAGNSDAPPLTENIPA